MIGAAAAGWLVAAVLLWRSAMPDLRLPDVDPVSVFPADYLDRSERYQRFHRANWVLATIVQLAVLVACVRLAPRVRVRGIPGGVALGVATLVAVWAAGLPFVLQQAPLLDLLDAREVGVRLLDRGADRSLHPLVARQRRRRAVLDPLLGGPRRGHLRV